MVDEVAELLAVARAAARIDVEHHVARCRIKLNLRGEAVAVVGKRSAVNLQDERVLLGRIEARRLDDPPLNLAAIL